MVRYNVAGFYEHGNNPSSSTIGEKCLDQLSESQLNFFYFVEWGETESTWYVGH
jgi:hypothetical protein